MYDAVNVFAHSIGSLDGPSNIINSANISCKSSNRWANGTFLYDRLNSVSVFDFFVFVDRRWVNKSYSKYIIFFFVCTFRYQVAIEGLTGKLHFDEGRRSDVKLDLLKLHQEKVRKVGFWTPSTGINITKHSVFYGQQSSNVTLIVVTRVVSSMNLR